MKPPLRTDLRVSAETVDGEVSLKNHAVMCGGKLLRVEMLDALIIGRSGSISGTALASVLEAGCSIVWEGKGGVLSFTPALRDQSTEFAQRQAECFALKTERLAAVRRMMDIRFDEAPPKSYRSA